MKNKILVFFFTILLINGAILVLAKKNVDGYKNKITELENRKPDTVIVEKDVYIPENDTLTDWQIMIMAIIGNESEYNKYANSEYYHGYFQMSKWYINEANKHTENNITIENIKEFDNALDAFNSMNDTYNPTYDIDKAILLHNPKGGRNYLNRIKKRMKQIERYEITRNEMVSAYAKFD